jgi:ATP-dependent Clp protease ATP-binding subunit ClpC
LALISLIIIAAFVGGWWLLSRDPNRGNLSTALIAWLQRLFDNIWNSLASRLKGPPLATAPANEALRAPDPEPSLADRLRALESAFVPISESASHPREFAGHPAFQEAVSLLKSGDAPLKTVLQYALGTNWSLSCVALAALAERPDGADALDKVLAAFDRLPPWAMHYALTYFLSLPQRLPLGAPFANAKEWWRDNPVLCMVAQDYFDEAELRGGVPSFGDALGSVPVASYPIIRGFFERVHHASADVLIAELDARQQAAIDRVFLSAFGRFWSGGEKLGFLIEPAAWSSQLSNAEASVKGQPFRSLLVCGEPGIGKTSFLKLLAKRLEPDGWSVFEAGGAELMAGQQWFGQLEGRIQKAVEELSTAKKLIWYIPDILQIALSGTHQGQAASILEQILPAVSSGRLIVWTEASAAGAARLLRMRPQLRNVFETVRFEALSKEEALSLAQSAAARISGETGLKIDPACPETALAVARQYLSGTSLPGSALDLLKSAIARALKDKSGSVAPCSVIAALSQATGVPAAILDNKERADLAAIRKYFAARVIGQDEAVSTIVDRIAMLKAGLNDPGKPIGVFLFAGPTGTGKTELAKTLAEYLFGSADRLIRLDMSEFQAHDSTWKILGTADPAAQTETLIGRVRKQPFSVVLLDEFEKAHANVWDLFLQVFDDARLTDALGQEADFRHCIIILTTNLGAIAHRGADLGFLPAAANFSSEQVMRAVSQTFRPEFQNRLDKVIIFQPLTRELMRSILKKELGRVLERRGFKDREWAVEWEASALEFLLEKGFSPEMGARPLKRAIDQYVIAPLAATIVERRFPEGDQFLFIRSDGKAIQAEFVDPDGEEGVDASADAPAANGRVPLPAMILAASGTAAEVQSLEEAYQAIIEQLGSKDWEREKEGLSESMQGANFWNSPERYELLARLALMDRVRAAAGTAESLRARLAKAPARGGKAPKELIARLALQLHLIGEGIKDVFEAAPVEAALTVEPALDGAAESGDAQAWCGQLLGMYRGWAAARNMQLTEIPGGVRGKETPVLLAGGFGAHRALRNETGLHVLEVPDDGKTVERVTARVRIVPVPLGDLPPARLRAALAAAFSQAGASNTLIRRYRNGASPLVRDMAAGWRSGRLDAVLRGNFDLIGTIQQ